jgi:hypothetical protein
MKILFSIVLISMRDDLIRMNEIILDLVSHIDERSHFLITGRINGYIKANA